MIDLTTFHKCLVQSTARGYDLDEKQKEAVKYGDGPLWLLAAYPAVSWIQTKKVGDLANTFAEFITNHLIGDKIISDLSQCVLLLRSDCLTLGNKFTFKKTLLCLFWGNCRDKTRSITPV